MTIKHQIKNISAEKQYIITDVTLNETTGVLTFTKQNLHDETSTTVSKNLNDIRLRLIKLNNESELEAIKNSNNADVIKERETHIYLVPFDQDGVEEGIYRECVWVAAKNDFEVLGSTKTDLVPIRNDISILQNLLDLEIISGEGKLNRIDNIETLIDTLAETKVDKAKVNPNDNDINPRMKVLSDNNYTDEEKQKLYGIEDNANNYTHPSYTARIGKPTGNSSPAFGDSVTVSQIKSDNTGHVSSVTDKTITIPSTTANSSTNGLAKATSTTPSDVSLSSSSIGTDNNEFARFDHVHKHPTGISKTGQPTANQSPGFGENFKVTQFSSNATGHISSATDRTITLPSNVATTSSNGLMSASDKEKLDGIAPGAGHLTVDDHLDPNSTNPVQNAVICENFYDKDDIIELLNSIEVGTGKLLTIVVTEDGHLIVDDDGFDYYTEDEANALFSPIDHEHGNITNDGKIGTTANKPLKTTTGGSVSTGDWESNTNNIKMNGTASVGVSNNFVRADHVHPSDTTKVDTAGTGLSKIGTTLNHSNSVTVQTTTALKKISYDTEGHITGSANVTASDLPSNIPTSKISGLSTVATSGKYTDLNDLPSDYEYIESTHSSSTSTWTGTSSRLTSLTSGTTILYKLNQAPSSTNVTLNLTLSDGTTTGAKEVWLWDNQRVQNQYPKYSIMGLVYDGSVWRTINPSTSNNNNNNNNDNNNHILGANTITSGEALTKNTFVGAKKDGKYYTLANGMVLDVSYPIVYTNDAYTSGQTSNANYYICYSSATTNHGISNLTSNKSIYLEGTGYSNGQFTISSNVFTQTLTNNRYYILLGEAYGSYTIRFRSNMTVYRYDGNQLIPIGASYNDLANKPSSFPPSIHNHDDRYYTESEIDTVLSNKVSKSSTSGLLKNDGTVDTTSYSTFSGSYDDLANKPSSFPPSSHTHTKSNITDYDVEYIESTHNTSTSTWTGTCTQLTEIRNGTIIYYKLLQDAVNSDVTLNLTLANGTSTGAKYCYFMDSTRLTNQYNKNHVIGLAYDESANNNNGGWRVISPSTNNAYYNLVQGDYVDCGTTTISSGCLIACKKSDGKYYSLGGLANTVIDLNRTIYLSSNTINANTTSSNVNLNGPWTTITTTKSGLTLTAYNSIYIEGTAYSNNDFTVSSNILTQTLVSGNYYIRIGTAYDTTHGAINLTNYQVLKYDGTNLIPAFSNISHTHSSNDIAGLTASKNVVTDGNGKLTTENKPTIPSASNSIPSADVSGGNIGSGTTWAKADHQHPLSSAYATASHTHSSNDVTGLTASKNVCTDANGKLSTENKNNHTHGSITNDGKIGNASGKIITTGSSGVLQASDFSSLGIDDSDIPFTATSEYVQLMGGVNSNVKEVINNIINKMYGSSYTNGELILF